LTLKNFRFTSKTGLLAGGWRVDMMMMYVDEVFHDGGKAKWVLVAEQHQGKTI
jgi:hypothetical protein